MFLLQTDGQGNEEWRKDFGQGYGSSVQETVDGGFIVTGMDFRGEVFLLKTDGQGGKQWRKYFGVGFGSSVQETVDGGFIVTGYDEDAGVLLKTDGQGNI